MAITVVEAAHTRLFTTVSRIHGILPSGTYSAEAMEDLIADASDAIVAFCDREFARAVFTEECAGDDRDVLMLSRTPIADLSAVRDRGTTLNPSGYRIYDREIGQIQRLQDVWHDSRPIIPFITSEVNVGRPGQLDYAVDFTAGYLMPGDDIVSQVIQADATDNAFVGSNFPLLASGDMVVVTGFPTSGNNGRHRVHARTSTRVIVTSTLVNETASGVSIACCTLPRDLQRACIDTVVTWAQSQGRDGSIVSEKIGDWSATYRGSSTSEGSTMDTGGLPINVAMRLQRWRRMV